MAGTHLIFSYGSNSTAQLRARLKNPNLQTQKALVKGYVRIFEGYSRAWQGSVASLARQEGGVVLGSVVELTDSERFTLDQYEGSYNLISVTASVFMLNGDITEKEAHVYIMGDDPAAPSMGSGLPFPSEQYLCAVSGMLAEHWPENQAHVIKIHTVDNGVVLLRGEWTHPHALGRFVSSFEALAIEINLRKENPWTMPFAANEFATMAVAAGFKTAREIWAVCRNLTPELAVAKITGTHNGKLNVDGEELKHALAKVVAHSGLEPAISD